MTDMIRIKRGTWSQLKSYVPTEGEPIYVTDLRQMRVGDGVASGGYYIGPWVTKPITLYVKPAADANASGLSWDEAIPLRTAFQRAITYNWRNLGDLTIQVGTGSYVMSQSFGEWKAGPPLSVVGSPSDPSLTTITTTFSHSYGGTFQASEGGFLSINGFTLSTTAANNSSNKQRGIVSWMGSIAKAYNVNFSGNWEGPFVSIESSVLEHSGNMTMSGVVRNAVYYVDGASSITIYPATTSYASTPTINCTISCVGASNLSFEGVRQFVGSSNTAYSLSMYGYSSVRRNGTAVPGTSTITGSNVNYTW